MTLPGFAPRMRAIASMPSLGLLTLAGMTPERHEVRYIEVAEVTAGLTELLDMDLVAISTLSAQAFEAYRLAERLRAAGVPVVMGGLHVTSVPVEALEHCDAVVIGEGEVGWPQVLNDAERGRLQRRYPTAAASFDLAEAPLPALELLGERRCPRLTVQSSRGCPYCCEFCASSVMLSPTYKQKPLEKVLAEIDRIREHSPQSLIEFADDNSLVNRSYWKKLLPSLSQRRVRWFAETDVSIGADDELLRLMHASGCVEVLLGLESPVESGLAGLELRSDWKRRQLPRYKALVDNIQRHGIRVNGCFIVGLDGHGPEIFDHVYRAVEALELYDVQVTVPTPFPNTPLYYRLRAEGRLLEDLAWDKCTLFDVNFRPSPMSVQELTEGFRGLVARLYREDFTRWRRERFRRRSLANAELEGNMPL